MNFGPTRAPMENGIAEIVKGGRQGDVFLPDALVAKLQKFWNSEPGRPTGAPELRAVRAVGTHGVAAISVCGASAGCSVWTTVYHVEMISWNRGPSPASNAADGSGAIPVRMVFKATGTSGSRSWARIRRPRTVLQLRVSNAFTSGDSCQAGSRDGPK